MFIVVRLQGILKHILLIMALTALKRLEGSAVQDLASTV